MFCLEESLRQRYAPKCSSTLWRYTDKDKRISPSASSTGGPRICITSYSDLPTMDEYTRKDTYKALEQIFYEQCEVREETVSIKQKTGGNVMQNPSDPDATYDGHKGSRLSGHRLLKPAILIMMYRLSRVRYHRQRQNRTANAVEEVLDDLHDKRTSA